MIPHPTPVRRLRPRPRGDYGTLGFRPARHIATVARSEIPRNSRLSCYGCPSGARPPRMARLPLESTPPGSRTRQWGFGALGGNTTSSQNTAVGTQSLLSNTGFNNTALGTRAGFANTTGSGNTAAGEIALYSNNRLTQTWPPTPKRSTATPRVRTISAWVSKPASTSPRGATT